MILYLPGSSVDNLGHADLGLGAAEQQARVLAGAGDLADAELAVALVFPTAPLGEDQAELVLLLGDLEGRIGQQIFFLTEAGGSIDECKSRPTEGKAFHDFRLCIAGKERLTAGVLILSRMPERCQPLAWLIVGW